MNLEVVELERAVRFYDRLLPVLGFRCLPRSDPAWVGYRKGRTSIWITVSRPRRAVRRAPSVPTDGAADPISDHIGFRVPTAEALASIERALLRAGLRPVYPLDSVPTRGRTAYVSDAWQDPDHNVIELYTVVRRR